MAKHYISTVTISVVVLLASLIISVATTKETISLDVDLLEFSLNLEYLEAEFFLFGAMGIGLDGIAPELADGGPPSYWCQNSQTKGQCDPRNHWAIKSTVKGFPRPLLDLSKSSFAKLMDKAFGRPLHPPFDPYANDINFLLASYLIPYVGLTGYVGANPFLQNVASRQLVAGLLGVESGQDAVIRTLLYERRALKVKPYGVSVAEFTYRISNLRNILGNGGLKDVGVSNILVGDATSLSYSRSPREILRIIYGSGHESIPGGFYPKGGNGRIARYNLHTT
ncbi:unnamed protein product [Trifolium pratense]|uniref:Uncharacterized protein n=1 Tax=Trifolium pratense TaxID=57577 RepID=A0ACB0KZF7_TRIPR|nr:unnamed protein product [Trifolium pratense]